MKLHSATVSLAAQGLTAPLLVHGNQNGPQDDAISKNIESALTGSRSLRAGTFKAMKAPQEPEPMESKALKRLCIPSHGKHIIEPDVGILSADSLGAVIDVCMRQDERCLEDSSSPLGGFCIAFESKEVYPAVDEAVIAAPLQSGRSLLDRTLCSSAQGNLDCPTGEFCDLAPRAGSCYPCSNFESAESCDALPFAQAEGISNCVSFCGPFPTDDICTGLGFFERIICLILSFLASILDGALF